MSDNFELNKQMMDLKTKFDYAFLGLIFATLALSFQYSPTIGCHWPWLLILSWILLLASGILAGIIQLKLIKFYKNGQSLKNLNFIIKYQKENKSNPPIDDFINPGPLYDEIIHKYCSNNDAFLDNQIITNKRDDLYKSTSDINTFSTKLFRLKIILYLLGIIILGFFTTINYLYKCQ